MLKEKFNQLERKLSSEIKSFYGTKLVTFVIYESVARGTQRANSDIDILIVAKDLENRRMERVKNSGSSGTGVVNVNIR